MELVSLVKEAFQSIAEHAASYRMGQSALRYLDRTLWVVEKCARWAVPPPLDQDDRPQPELVRPLPWVFFLALIVALRITRESISLLNLVMGKPPLRSADVVMFIQSKRRYLRTLKYQGNRMMRARTGSVQPRESWSNALHSLFEFTMCFRRNSNHYGNNNTTRVSNNDEVLVVKRSKRGREHASPAAATSETTMERLIEKMLVDLDADSDEDSSFTLTNVTSPKSDRSDFTTESDQDTIYHNNIPNQLTNEHCQVESPFSPNMSEIPCSTPERTEASLPKETETPPRKQETFTKQEEIFTNEQATSPKQGEMSPKQHAISPKQKSTSPKQGENSPKQQANSPKQGEISQKKVDPSPKLEETRTTDDETTPIEQETYPSNNETPKSMQHETSPSKIPRTPNNEQKIANGRTVKSVPSKKKGSPISEKDRRNSDMQVGKNISGNNTL